MQLTDCHSHVTGRWLADDARRLLSVLRRCAAHQVSTVAVSVDCSSGAPELDLAGLRAVFRAAGVRLLVTLGFEPPADLEAMATLEQRLEQATSAVRTLHGEQQVAAIGEVGLDRHWPTEFIIKGTGDAPSPPDAAAQLERCLALQKRVFEHWIELARQLDLPLVVHERAAHPQARQVLDSSSLPPGRVMFHCFGGSPQQAVAAAAQGYWISIPSSVAYRDTYKEVVAVTELSRLLIETDSPYHSPFQGLWKQHGQQARAAAEASGARGKGLEQAVSQTRSRSFFELVEQVFPGLAFEDAAGGAVPASERLKRSKARFHNEPTFVRCAAHEIAAIKGLDLAPTCSALQANAEAFFSPRR